MTKDSNSSQPLYMGSVGIFSPYIGEVLDGWSLRDTQTNESISIYSLTDNMEHTIITVADYASFEVSNAYFMRKEHVRELQDMKAQLSLNENREDDSDSDYQQAMAKVTETLNAYKKQGQVVSIRSKSDRVSWIIPAGSDTADKLSKAFDFAATKCTHVNIHIQPFTFDTGISTYAGAPRRKWGRVPQ